LTEVLAQFYPTNALNVSISDFYKCDITNSIAIEATFTDFPEAFLLPDKYGRYLTKPGKKEAPRPRTFPENSKVQSSSDDVIGGRSWKEIETFREPEDSNHLYLRARLTISSSFDPEWTIVSDAQEPTFFRQSDRKVLNVSSIGLDCRKDLAWGQGSVLRKKTVSALCCYETANKAFKLIFTPYNGTNLGIALPSA
jgi:hypothetical protein